MAHENQGKQLPLVSVIVPAYNYGHLLHETLENLCEQTHKNWECIIVDDGSQDNTAEIAKQWVNKDPRFLYIYQQNAGLSAARNTGIHAAKGSFIQLQDADDLLSPLKLARQLEVFEQQPDTDIVYGEVRFFTTENKAARYLALDCSSTHWMPGSSSANQLQLIKDLFRVNLYAVNCPLIRKEVFEKIGNFDTALRSVEDWDYWCRCAFAGISFYFDPSPEAWALVRTHENSMSRNKTVMLEAARTVRYKIMKLIKNYPEKAIASELELLNRNQTAFTVQQLVKHYKEGGQGFLFLKRLFEFSRLKGDYKYFFREAGRYFLAKA
ncbi:MAG: glycosyltransferase family 2 protein [Bacteroidia bacterium]|nr:glycosyltransferase family 2 protein [Bacteroidia bacterium]MCC6768712.1 glycosyltransferase family 2 protein [Bacteroidia bacterium]